MRDMTQKPLSMHNDRTRFYDTECTACTFLLLAICNSPGRQCYSLMPGVAPYHLICENGFRMPASALVSALPLAKAFQKRSVSSPAPVTMVCPSGDMARYKTRKV